MFDRRVSLSAKPHVNNVAPKSTAILKFQWSTSAAQLLPSEQRSSFALPSVATDRSQRRVFGSISYLSEQTLDSFYSTSTRKSFALPNISKQNHSQTLTNEDSKSCDNFVLSVDYTQLYREQAQRPPSPVPIKQENRTRLSISPLPFHRRHSTANRSNRRSSVRSRSSVDLGRKRSSISSLSETSSISSKQNIKFGNQTFVRLNPTALRQLNVSQQYIREASKLYFNVKCKSFIPRVAITKVC